MTRNGKPPANRRKPDGPSTGPAAGNRPRRRSGGPPPGGDRIPATALTIWTAKGVTQFKLGVIRLDETGSNAALELAARARARPIEAEVVYAYLLERPKSSAWWREWGGYDLEQELLYEAVMARPAVKALLASFDPKDNEWGVTDRDDYADLLVHAHHAEIDADDIRRGFRNWLSKLAPDARRLFANDLRKWMDGR
ncbi:MAG: hypothetical protein ACMVY4_08110 [Minwuia sp.]|uniref:hypothetical protein n=1 Tax=Minwuia sp. TaxID=2493630 RepID=UPI003A873C86